MAAAKLLWREHKGLRRPVSEETTVFIEYRNGHQPIDPIPAGKRKWDWFNGRYEWEIVKYAVSKAE